MSGSLTGNCCTSAMMSLKYTNNKCRATTTDTANGITQVKTDKMHMAGSTVIHASHRVMPIYHAMPNLLFQVDTEDM